MVDPSILKTGRPACHRLSLNSSLHRRHRLRAQRAPAKRVRSLGAFRKCRDVRLRSGNAHQSGRSPATLKLWIHALTSRHPGARVARDHAPAPPAVIRRSRAWHTSAAKQQVPHMSLLQRKGAEADQLICPTGQISLINSHRFISFVRSSMAPNRLRRKANFVSGFKQIGISSPGLKIFLSENRKLWYVSPSRPA